MADNGSRELPKEAAKIENEGRAQSRRADLIATGAGAAVGGKCAWRTHGQHGKQKAASAMALMARDLPLSKRSPHAGRLPGEGTERDGPGEGVASMAAGSTH